VAQNVVRFNMKQTTFTVNDTVRTSSYGLATVLAVHPRFAGWVKLRPFSGGQERWEHLNALKQVRLPRGEVIPAIQKD
jgi:hypothetical protein